MNAFHRHAARASLVFCLLLLPALVPSPRMARAQESVVPSEGQARALLARGEFRDALAAVEALLESEPESADLWALAGSAHMGLEEFDAAEEAFLKSKQFEADGPQTDYNLGILYAKTGDLDRAFEAMHRAKDSGQLDMTFVGIDPRAAELREDPRVQSLFPSVAEFADPFVEDDVIVLQERRGEAVNDWFGWIARNIGDVDGDGVSDWTTSAPNAAKGDEPRAGKVYTYSGRGGALLWTASGEANGQLGMGIEAAGDVNADGAADVIAGAPGNGRALVYSGDDGRVLWTFEARQEGENFGRKVTDLGDVDGDGHDDVLVGAPGNDEKAENAGAAYVYSGASGELLLALYGDSEGAAFGSAAAGARTSDGPVLLVGAPGAGDTAGGRVYAYTDLSGEARFVFDADETGNSFGGMFLSIVGDVDADGHSDLYVSDWSNNARGRSTGRIYVYSGVDGHLLQSITGEAAGDGFGIGPADVGDVDGDGHDDLLVGAWQQASAAPSGGRVYLYSGRDGSLLRTITSRVMGETFGFDATGMGDVDGDGRIDYLLTSAWSAVNGARSGRVFLIKG